MSRHASPGPGSVDGLLLERAAARWLEDGPERAPERLAASLVAAVEVTPQQRRRVWWRMPLWRPGARAMAAATLVMLVTATSALQPGALHSLVEGVLPPACGSGVLVTVVGQGIGPGVDAVVAAPLEAPTAVAVAADGTLYVSDPAAGVVWRISPDGVSAEIGSQPSAQGPGAGPDQIAITWPRGIALDADGDLYVVDGAAPRILKLDPTGAMSVVAGSGVSGSSGDGGPAIAAQVESWTIATGPSGELYLDAASRYRVIDAAGMIAPFAGSGVPGWSGDGGPATEASILTAAGIAVAPDGRVFLGDQARIRMVDTTGVITTIAGTGSSGVPADGASARASHLLAPGAMAVGPEGSLYLVDGDAVRMIDPSGILRTVAGAVTSGAGPHCGSALGPTLASPGGLAVHDGALYIADTGNARVVKVVP